MMHTSTINFKHDFGRMVIIFKTFDFYRILDLSCTAALCRRLNGYVNHSLQLDLLYDSKVTTQSTTEKIFLCIYLLTGTRTKGEVRSNG